MPGRFEIRKDQVQEAVETGATRVGNVVGIVTGAVRDVAHEVGEWATDMIELREAGRKASADEERRTAVEGQRPRVDPPAED